MNVSLQNEIEWKLLKLRLSCLSQNSFRTCLGKRGAALLCDLANIGKTFTARAYVKAHSNVIHVDCSQVKNKSRLIRFIAKSLPTTAPAARRNNLCAYGAALYAKKKSKGVGKSTITDKKGLDEFVHEIKVANCGMCNNNCRLTINSFGKGRKFIAGNRCERPITKKAPANDMNMYAYKLNLIDSYKPVEGIRGKLGIPMALNMYELYPFWYRFFTELKFEVFHSPYSTRKLYQRGQQTIPSDTVCFPAKLVHGHIQTLIDMGAETIFYPCLSYNFDEHLGDNHYNCPVVAYYPEVIKNNMKDIRKVHFIKEYFGIHRPNDFPVPDMQA